MSKTRKRPPRPGLLKDKAYVRIKERFLSDDFAPGTFVSERQVAGLLKLSKTPIKAAFERLEHEGFITVSPQQGVVARDLNLQEIADHFELRTTLECYTVRDIAGRLTAEQGQALKQNLDAQKANLETENAFF